MLTKREIFLKATKEFKLKKQLREKLNKINFKIATTKCPELEKLIQKLKQTKIKLIKIIFNKPFKNNRNFYELINVIKTENLEIQKKIKTLLKQNQISENFLNTKPSCTICNDDGVVKNEYCKCFKKILIEISTQELKKNSCFELKNFDEFNLKKYDNLKLINNQVSELTHMTAIKHICENFAHKFPNVDYGLLMFGDTGLGKTHLSLAIASTIINKGFSVIYATATEIIKKMSNYHFEHQQTNDELKFLNLINETELLIIDDLGTEIKSQTNASKMFEILNIRTALKKPIILSTNLNSTEFEKRYGKRTTSRIFNNLKILKFIGTDNRNRFKNNYNYHI